LQVKLLRVLQSREYSPVGDTRVLKADVRVVAATNVDLEDAVRDGRFREDLYYRLNVIHVAVPALRERAADVPALVEHFFVENRDRSGRIELQGVSPAAMRILMDYSWPGNVRELANCVERAVLLCRGETIEPSDLPPRVCGLGNEPRGSSVNLPDAGVDLRKAVESYENQLIRQALDRCQWNKKRAANLLGLNRTTPDTLADRKVGSVPRWARFLRFVSATQRSPARRALR
jgi:DNA-binding NtrC family response regulator